MNKIRWGQICRNIYIKVILPTLVLVRIFLSLWIRLSGHPLANCVFDFSIFVGGGAERGGGRGEQILQAGRVGPICHRNHGVTLLHDVSDLGPNLIVNYFSPILSTTCTHGRQRIKIILYN